MMMRASSPSASLSGLSGRQVDRHVDVVQIKKRNDACARIDDLSGFLGEILYCTRPLRGATESNPNRMPRFDRLQPARS